MQLMYAQAFFSGERVLFLANGASLFSCGLLFLHLVIVHANRFEQLSTVNALALNVNQGSCMFDKSGM